MSHCPSFAALPKGASQNCTLNVLLWLGEAGQCSGGEASCSTFPLIFTSFASASPTPLCKTNCCFVNEETSFYCDLLMAVWEGCGRIREESNLFSSAFVAACIFILHILSGLLSCSLQALFLSLAITLIHILLQAAFTTETQKAQINEKNKHLYFNQYSRLIW